MAEQIPLFSSKKLSYPPPPLVNPKECKPESTIGATLWPYHNHLVSAGYSQHTVEAFTNDVKLFKEFLGDKPVGNIGLQDMKNFIAYLKESKKGKPKSLYRRVTSLKNYFGWLFEEKVLPQDPSLSLVFRRAIPPLPEILKESECQRLISEASKNARDYVLVTLLLEAGLKRNELLEVKPDDIDISNVYRPEVRIVANNPKKERRLILPADIVPAYKEYLDKYQYKEKLFPYTERNLNFILKGMAERSGISKSVSCQILRDTFAVRKLKAGENIDRVLRALGLAPTTYNHETKEKYLRLAARAA